MLAESGTHNGGCLIDYHITLLESLTYSNETLTFKNPLPNYMHVRVEELENLAKRLGSVN